MHKPLLLTLLVLAGSAAAAAAEGNATVALPGTLYVEKFSTLLDSLDSVDLSVIRNGAVVSASSAPGMPLIAREKPDVRVTGNVAYAQHLCRPLAISPTGASGLCVWNGEAIRFAPGAATAAASQLGVALESGSSDEDTAAFPTDDRVVLVARERTCPTLHAGSTSSIQQGRARVVDMAGHLVAAGPCVEGVVAGAGKIAYWKHTDAGEIVSSLDGAHWKPGKAATFDGQGRLLTIDLAKSELLDPSGAVVATDVAAARWTK